MQNIRISNGSSEAIFPSSTGYVLYREAWTSLKYALDSDLSKLSDFIFSRIDSFIKDSHVDWLSAHGFTTAGLAIPSSNFCAVQAGQIPTALLLAGVNTPDHNVIYQRIFSSILMQGGRVALINPGTDTMSPRSLVASAVKQFLQPNRDMFKALDTGFSQTMLLEDEFETQENPLQSFTSATKFTYLALSEWYYSRTKMPKQQSPPKPSDQLSTPAPGSPSVHSRRSLSQPSSRTPGRPLRSSMFPRSNQQSTGLGPRRFTARSRAVDKSIVTPSTRSASVSAKVTNDTDMDNPGPLVVILPQVESIPSHVLEEFIQLTSIYLSGQAGGCSRALPIYLVLGLSTSPEAGFESRLCASTLGRLKTERFTVPPPAEFLETVFKALIQFPGFRLTHSMNAHLVDSLFLCLDYSVQNFLRRIQFCMLEHYLNCPNPELLLPIEQAHSYLTALPPTELANVLALHYPSMASFVTDPSSSPPVSPSGRLKANPSLVDRLTAQLALHWKVQYMVSPVLNWLHRICSPLSAQPLGKSVFDFYRIWLKNGLVHSEEFKLTVNLLSGLSKENLVLAVDGATDWLESHLKDEKVGRFCHLWSPAIVQECCAQLAELLTATRQWCDSMYDASTEVVPETGHLSSPASPAAPNSAIQALKASALDGKRKMSLRGLRQHLQQIAASSPARFGSPRARPQTQWEQKRSAFLNWLRTELPRLIPCPSNLPLHEVFYGPMGPQSADLSPHQLLPLSLRRRLNPPYQRCLHQALCDPGTYLQIPQFHLDSPDSLTPALPDLCILYKLHLESTKMINLYDWLMAFATVLGEEVDREHPPTKSIQARFFHGLAQLHQFGYIKPTRHKADHVMRLTWGITV